MKEQIQAASTDLLEPTSRTTILCVDDDPDITCAIQKILSNYDVDVISDCCGRLGTWDVYKKKPDLIITDLRMPDGDGQHLLEEVKVNAQTSHIPVIVLTGQRDAHLPGRLRHLGAAGFLQKPVHYTSLLAEIRRFVSLTSLDWATANKNGLVYKQTEIQTFLEYEDE
ncbi:response regulator [Gimesia algae]|uniref:Sensor histidine kinase TodS n=1 Tax=Gimesia algae TaxID=2527971 RepID=A0A517VFV8_9PLAN|nr:response regulator [Gimesia algae]QDT91869.1 Sensor histidine kinase TodS [Gimesia algae]